jgi:glycosyltransferase involved in cell wall biosynthesis
MIIKNDPKVSIIMATYNREKFILETLIAIQNQTFSNWECIIIDDGGTDKTAQIINPIISQDNRFHFIKRTNNYQKGLPGCRNFGLYLAKGEYIIFFDDDDIPHPQNLELCVKELADNEISFCRYVRNVFFGDFHYNFDLSKEYTFFYIDKNDIEKMLNNELQFNSCSVMWRSTCFTENKFAENLMYAEEWELYARIVSSGHRGISIDKCLFYGRKHENSNTGEFYNNDPIRRESYTEAILLVLQNLKDKEMLTYSIKRYFIAIANNFKEYKLYENILNVLELSKFERLIWNIFFAILPTRLFFHSLRKKYLK